MLHVNSTHYVNVVCIIFRQNNLSKHFENVVICSVEKCSKRAKKYFVYKSCAEILTLFLTCTMHWEFITFNKKNESVIKSTL